MSEGTPPDDELVPISVRLGEVVPPEDPEDWTRPLTWVAAFGMLAPPAMALAWFAVAPPSQGATALPATYVLALALAAGAASTGATQQGIARASTATLGAGLFGALGVVIVGVAMAGERQVGVASPTLSHAFGAAVGGLAGVAAGTLAAALTASRWQRATRFVVALGAGVLVAAIATGMLMPAQIGG